MINIDNRVVDELKLNNDELGTLFHILKRINKTNTAFPSRHLLMKETGCGRKRLSKAIKGLITKGVISTTQQIGEDGRFNKTIYKIIIDGFGVYLGAKGVSLEETDRDTHFGSTDKASAQKEPLSINHSLSINHYEEKKENSEKEFPSLPYESIEEEIGNKDDGSNSYSIQTLLKKEKRKVPLKEKRKFTEVDVSTLDDKDQYYFQIANAFRKLIIEYVKEANGITKGIENMRYKEVDHIRRMIEIDGVTEQQMKLMYDYLKSNDYWWRKNVRSLSAVRKHANSILTSPPKQTSEDKKREILNNFKPFVPNY